MGILNSKTKPTQYDENNFYVLSHVIELKGRHPYRLLNVSDGMRTLIFKAKWKAKYIKEGNFIVIFPSKTELTTEINCESKALYQLYDELKKQKGVS